MLNFSQKCAGLLAKNLQQKESQLNCILTRLQRIPDMPGYDSCKG